MGTHNNTADNAGKIEVDEHPESSAWYARSVAPGDEDTLLFSRGVGEETDIVRSKINTWIYIWEDRARAQSETASPVPTRRGCQ